MPIHGSLIIERMCKLAPVSRRILPLLQDKRVEDTGVRAEIQISVVEHRRRYGYRRVKTAEFAPAGHDGWNRKRVALIIGRTLLANSNHPSVAVTTDSPQLVGVLEFGQSHETDRDAISYGLTLTSSYIRLKAESLSRSDSGPLFRKVVGWALDRTLATRLPVAALNMRSPKLNHHWPGHHSDSRCAVRFRGICADPTAAWNDSEHESASETLTQR